MPKLLSSRYFMDDKLCVHAWSLMLSTKLHIFEVSAGMDTSRDSEREAMLTYFNCYLADTSLIAPCLTLLSFCMLFIIKVWCMEYTIHLTTMQLIMIARFYSSMYVLVFPCLGLVFSRFSRILSTCSSSGEQQRSKNQGPCCTEAHQHCYRFNLLAGTSVSTQPSSNVCCLYCS